MKGLQLLGDGRRMLSLILVPFLVVTLLLSVIVPAFEMERVTRLLSEIGQIVGPVEGVSLRLRQVKAHEQESLYVNATLVIIALAAIASVVVTSARERQLAAALERRVEEEAATVRSETALREAAEALAGAFSMEDVSQQIAQSALEATHARGAFVETVSSSRDGTAMLVVRGAVGIDVPLMGSTRPYAGSLSERAVEQQVPAMLTGMEQRHSSSDSVPADAESSHAMILPIKDANGPVGALVLSGIPRAEVRPQDTAWAGTISHLAALAYEKVRILEETREGSEELERLMKSRQRLMRGFSHDVKNPLGAADGYADLLSAGIYGNLEDEQRESVLRIRRSIRRALNLVDDLLELAHAESGTLAMRKESVNIADLVERTGDEYRGAAHAAGLPLTVDVADDIPLIETDGARVAQIVSNLISNAIKYTRSGSIKLRARKYPTRLVRNVSSWIDIEVTDTGIGIPADKHEQIFEEFSRLNTSDRPGAGLGLAISKRIAESLGGQILVTSEVGRGSTFTFRLPMTQPPLVNDVVPSSAVALLPESFEQLKISDVTSSAQ